MGVVFRTLQMALYPFVAIDRLFSFFQYAREEKNPYQRIDYKICWQYIYKSFSELCYLLIRQVLNQLQALTN
jgi:hypothetical protein